MIQIQDIITTLAEIEIRTPLTRCPIFPKFCGYIASINTNKWLTFQPKLITNKGDMSDQSYNHLMLNSHRSVNYYVLTLGEF